MLFIDPDVSSATMKYGFEDAGHFVGSMLRQSSGAGTVCADEGALTNDDAMIPSDETASASAFFRDDRAVTVREGRAC